jgi:hypothetical protein
MTAPSLATSLYLPMLQHSLPTSSRSYLVSPRRFGAVAALLLALAACSSKGGDRPHESPIGAGSGGASAGAGAGAAGSPGGIGGYRFVDGLDEGGSGGSSGSESDALDGGAPDPYVLPPSVTLGDAGVALCGNSPCACNNGADDDGDGKTDGFDEECTGALDNDEGSFSTGIPGDNSDPKWQDCFFDGNSGAGDDHCRYHADCLTGVKPPTDPDCAVSTDCHDFCAARTPNGCDCFGCCSVQLADASSVSVFIGESCSLENVDDPASCPRCTPSTACGNTCGECELCPGKSIEDLPASCSETPGAGGSGGGDVPPYSCDADQTVCSDAGGCPGGYYCSLGCCLAFVIY